jgi:hypothetical protein
MTPDEFMVAVETEEVFVPKEMKVFGSNAVGAPIEHGFTIAMTGRSLDDALAVSMVPILDHMIEESFELLLLTTQAFARLFIGVLHRAALLGQLTKVATAIDIESRVMWNNEGRKNECRCGNRAQTTFNDDMPACANCVDRERVSLNEMRHAPFTIMQAAEMLDHAFRSRGSHLPPSSKTALWSAYGFTFCRLPNGHHGWRTRGIPEIFCERCKRWETV